MRPVSALKSYNFFMATTLEFIFFLSLIVTVIMGAISYTGYRQTKSKESAHQTELWGSLAASILFSYFFQNVQPQIVALSMVGWIWPLRASRLVMEDLSARKLIQRWEYVLLTVGGFASVALATYGFEFVAFATPFALSVGIVGCANVIYAWRSLKGARQSALNLATLGAFALYFASKLVYPFWRQELIWETVFFSLDLSLMIALSGLISTAALLVIQKKHSVELDSLIQERNAKLMGQSKYSELGMMSAGIAHEINNPLAVIQAKTTQLLRIYKDPQRSAELAQGLEQILYTSERINRTIQGVREFVHQDDKGPHKKIPLKALIDDVLAFCGQRLKNHGVNLRLYGLENISVKGNKIQLEQILLNLINNSFDAIEFLSDKWIELTATEEDNRVKIVFKDSGSGIPAEVAARMMEPFFSTKELGKGTGLGLALAQGIAEQHGGKLSYLSESSHTAFLLEIPVGQTSEWEMPLVH